MRNNVRILSVFTLFSVLAASSAGWFAYSAAKSSLEHAARNSLTQSRENKRRQVEAFYAVLRSEILFDATRAAHGATRANEFPRHLGVRARLIWSCQEPPREFPVTVGEAIARACSPGASNQAISTDLFWNGNAAISFLMTPHAGGSSLLVYEVSAEPINRMMLAEESWRSEGFGHSGETYVVGADGLMRTDSRFAVESLDAFLAHLSSLGTPPAVLDSIRSRRSTVLALPVNTVSARSGLAGETGTRELRDYRQAAVLSSYTPLNIPGLNWVLLSEIDSDEAFASVTSLRSNLLLFTAILILVFLFVGSLLARAVALPLDRLARQAIGMSEELQRRIGADLHDDLAQRLVGTAIIARTVSVDLENKGVSEAADVRRVADLLDDAVRTTRDLARGLSPIPQMRHGLVDALRQLGEETRRVAQVEVDADDDVTSLSQEAALHAYRIAQEALTNALKHGKASRVRISLESDRQDLHLRVANNGRPSAGDDDSKGMGLALMAMRCRALDGTLSFRTRDDGWTEVHCHIPLPRSSK